MLTQHERITRHADRFRSHDLVTKWIADHAVLMNPGFVSKRVAANDRLVRLHAKPDDSRQQLTGRINLLRVDSSFERQTVGAHVHRHHHFFQRSVTGALTDSVYRALDLSRAASNCGQTVSDGQAKVVVTVNADRDVGSLADDALAHGSDQL